MSEQRVSGTNTLRVQVFFIIETNKSLKEIVEKDRNEYKRDNVWIERKRTDDNYTNQVGFLTGPIIDRANLNYYDKMSKELGRIKDR